MLKAAHPVGSSSFISVTTDPIPKYHLRLDETTRQSVRDLAELVMSPKWGPHFPRSSQPLATDEVMLAA